MLPEMDDKNADIEGMAARALADRDMIVEFVRKQHDSESLKTRKAARAFLKKWGDG
jgi:hypothetical protein